MKKRRMIIGLLTILALTSEMMYVMPSHSATEPRDVLLGAYLWDGHLYGDRTPIGFRRSIAFLLDNGFSAIRFALTPEALSSYGISDRGCRKGISSQSCYLQEMLDGPELNDLRLKMVMITLHSFAAPVEKKLAGTDLTKLEAVLKQELDASIVVLHRRFSGRNVRVVLSNWEGDNLILCGAAWSFATDSAFRDNCKSRKPTVDERQKSFVRLMALRDVVVRKARNNSDLMIAHAPEINMAVSLCDTYAEKCSGERPVVERFAHKQELCSYSAYDTANQARLHKGLGALAKWCKAIIIGEVGFSTRQLGTHRVRLLYGSAVEAINGSSVNIEAVFFWNAFDDLATRVPGFGLFNRFGKPQNAALLPKELRDRLKMEDLNTLFH